MGADLGARLVDVRFDRPHRQIESLGDLTVAETLRHQLTYLTLAAGQPELRRTSRRARRSREACRPPQRPGGRSFARGWGFPRLVARSAVAPGRTHPQQFHWSSSRQALAATRHAHDPLSQAEQCGQFRLLGDPPDALQDDIVGGTEGGQVMDVANKEQARPVGAGYLAGFLCRGDRAR